MAGTRIDSIAWRLKVACCALALFLTGDVMPDATDGPLHIELRATSQIRPYENNPRLNDDAYCDVIVERWEQFAGRKAERVRPQKTPPNGGAGNAKGS